MFYSAVLGNNPVRLVQQLLLCFICKETHLGNTYKVQLKKDD